MGRFRGTGDDGGETGIDISPLIDCVFILLIFFIVTTTFVEERGVGLDRPQASNVPTDPRQEDTTVMLLVTDTGRVMHEGRDVGFGRVRDIVRTGLRRDSEAPVIVQAEPDAQSGILMRVVDEAKLAGAEKVSVATARSGGRS